MSRRIPACNLVADRKYSNPGYGDVSWRGTCILNSFVETTLNFSGGFGRLQPTASLPFIDGLASRARISP